MGDHTRFIDDIRDAAGKAGIPCPIGLAEHILGVAKQWELKTELLGKCSIGFNAIKARTQNLNIVVYERVIVVTEPVPLPRSTGGVGFGVKPQDNFLTSQLRQGYRGAIVRQDGKIRRLCPNLKHHRSP